MSLRVRCRNPKRLTEKTHGSAWPGIGTASNRIWKRFACHMFENQDVLYRITPARGYGYQMARHTLPCCDDLRSTESFPRRARLARIADGYRFQDTIRRLSSGQSISY